MRRRIPPSKRAATILTIAASIIVLDKMWFFMLRYISCSRIWYDHKVKMLNMQACTHFDFWHLYDIRIATWLKSFSQFYKYSEIANLLRKLLIPHICSGQKLNKLNMQACTHLWLFDTYIINISQNEEALSCQSYSIKWYL